MQKEHTTTGQATTNIETPSNGQIILGWREWVALPDLGMPAIKAKVDSGAKTSALHAFDLQRFQRNGKDFVRFAMHPLQNNQQLVVACEAALLDEREVSDSGGHREMRHVIDTTLVLGQYECRIEMTLTNRDKMRFRMLLGRRAMVNRMLIDPSASYLCGKLDHHKLYKQ